MECLRAARGSSVGTSRLPQCGCSSLAGHTTTPTLVMAVLRRGVTQAAIALWFSRKTIENSQS